MNDEQQVYSIGKFAKLTGKSISTLQKWDRAGKLHAHRTLTNRRYYTYDQYRQVMGFDNDNTQSHKKTVIYARVSSRNQKDDLESQEQFLRQFANARGIIVDNVITDIASGLNYNRKGFNDIMYSDDIDTVIIAYKDRFVRFGFDWFADNLKRRGINLIVVNNEQLSPQAEMIQDLISIIHVFSCRIYGLRKYKKEITNDKSL